MQRQTIYFLLFAFLFTSVNAIAQKTISASFSPDAWEVKAKSHEFKKIEGKDALYLENGKARLKNAQLENGIIDFDILFPEGRKFPGVHFRIQDNANYEEFYLRPHQSGNPDAMQYTPVFNGLSGWQLYHGKGHGVPFPFKFQKWMHVRLVIAGDQMEIFLDDMSKPTLYVPDLKMKTQSGGIGFGTNMGPAAYANLRYQAIDNPPFISTKESLPPPEKGTITSWQISDAFSVSELDKVYDLKKLTSKKSFKWKTGQTEFTGTINLAQYAKRTNEQNTVLTKVIINADSDQIKELELGFSDAAAVFVNDKLIYSGQRIFRSRDYRYLGTIGYFDSVYLDLKAGRNEVVIAVAENFGGWGLKAKLENQEGITIE